MTPKYVDYAKSKPRGEVNDARKFGKYVETIGYVPVDRQVDSFFRAGSRWIDTFSDKDYDSTVDDPVDDPLLDIRGAELEDIGHEMAGFMKKTDQALTASTEQASEAMSKSEADKNVVTGSDPKKDSE